MKRSLVAAMAVALAVATSCQDFFTNSLGTFAARDKYDLDKVTESQALDIASIAYANRDAALARALLPRMAELVADDADDPTLLVAALRVANLASGIDDAIADAMAEIGFAVLTGGDLDPSYYTTMTECLDTVTSNASTIAVYTAFAALMATDEAALLAAGYNAGDAAYAALGSAAGLLDATQIGQALTGLVAPGAFTPAFATPAYTDDIFKAANGLWSTDSVFLSLTGLFPTVLTP